MRTSTTSMPTLIPPNVWLALGLQPGQAVTWELRAGEAVLRPAAVPVEKPLLGVDDVAGMLAPLLKGRRIRWKDAQASALAAWGQPR